MEQNQQTHVCKECGQEKPLSEFNFTKYGKPYKCKTCYNAMMRAYRKKHGDDNEKETGHRMSEEQLRKSNIKTSIIRLNRKNDHGNTYRNEENRQHIIEKSNQYYEEHKNDEHFKEMRHRCGKNYRQRRDIKNQVLMLEEFFSNDFDF